jgi:hypothetical protein
MLSCCLFDRLPIELLHMLFTYFLAHDILLTFTDVSDYMNAILLAYSSYRVDFRSMCQLDLNLICHRMRPEQIVSLILSDSNPTSEFFFSRFHIEQFRHLQSLTIIEIEYDSIKSIFTNIDKLDRLRSFSFDASTVRHRYPAWNDDYRNESKRLGMFLQDSYVKLLPRLSHLNLNNTKIPSDISMPCLRYLTLGKSSFTELTFILQQASQLQSLTIDLFGNTWTACLNLPINQLISFNLKVEGVYIEESSCMNMYVKYKHVKLTSLIDVDTYDEYSPIFSNSCLFYC